MSELPNDRRELPEWIDLAGINECDCSGCDYVLHLREALAIAWEALETSKRMDDPWVEDALRRIEEIGK